MDLRRAAFCIDGTENGEVRTTDGEVESSADTGQRKIALVTHDNDRVVVDELVHEAAMDEKVF